MTDEVFNKAKHIKQVLVDVASIEKVITSSSVNTSEVGSAIFNLVNRDKVVRQEFTDFINQIKERSTKEYEEL